ncbi:MAG TPA: TdeIII family type II restriction endonuclease [Hanamia sp.]
MPFSKDVIERISIEVIKVLYKKFRDFPDDASGNRNAPFHKAFLKAFSTTLEKNVSDIPFFISLSSWLHGLNTTLGQSFFERVGHILSNGEKREYTSKKLGNLNIDRRQKEIITTIITTLSNAIDNPNLDNEDLKLIVTETTENISALDFSADIFIEDADKIIAIEMKSVRPNSGELRGEKQKILEGKAALKYLYPNKKILFFIGFSFDPTNSPIEPTGYDKRRFLASIINMNKYFHENEVLLASELWNFLSGEQNTMEMILDIINSIADVGFLKNYHFIINDQNRLITEEYKMKLIQWNLFSELELVDNDSLIKNKIGNDKRLQRIYNQLIFKEQKDFRIKYNFRRYNELKQLI